MKKTTLLCSLIALCACATTTDSGNGLLRLKSQPDDCQYLYAINTSVSTYKMIDAYDFLEKRILDHKELGDAYFVESEEVEKNEDAVFGPRNTYKLKAKVYKCQD